MCCSCCSPLSVNCAAGCLAAVMHQSAVVRQTDIILHWHNLPAKLILPIKTTKVIFPIKIQHFNNIIYRKKLHDLKTILPKKLLKTNVSHIACCIFCAQVQSSAECSDLLQIRLQSSLTAVVPTLWSRLQLKVKTKKLYFFEKVSMDAEPAPYQHRNLSQFVPNNHNIGLTDEQLVTISTKDFNKLLKNSG